MIQNEPSPAADAHLHKSGNIPLALAGPHEAIDNSLWRDDMARAKAEIRLDLSIPQFPFFDRRSLLQDPFAELADACFDAIQDIFQRPNTGFYRKMELSLRNNPVKGLIIRRYLWCDLWRAEAPRLKQWSRIPVLDLEIGEQLRDGGNRLRTRIQSFMEMMQ
jgi:hypothetical protein